MIYDEESLHKMTMLELVRVFNALPGASPVSEFRTKNQGVNRILALQDATISQDDLIHSLPDTATAEPLRPWAPSRPTVAQRTRELLLKGLTNSEAWEILCREYQMTTTPSYVQWYRNGLEHGFSRTAV